MKKHSWIMYLAGAVLLAALGWVAHTRSLSGAFFAISCSMWTGGASLSALP